MRDRFSGSMITVAIARGRCRRRHFGVRHADVGSGSGGFRHGAGRPGAENALGRTRSAGHLDRRNRHALAAPRQVCEPGILHRGAAGRIGSERGRRCAAGTSVRSAGPSSTSPAPTTRVFVAMKRTGTRTSLIVDPPDGRIPPLTPEAQKMAAAEREFRLALLQATETCKNK